MSDTYKASDGSSARYHACNCVGPQHGEPLCPCRMRGVQIKDGRYVEIVDHGPVCGSDASAIAKARRAIMNEPSIKDRHIQVSKNFPAAA